MKTKEGKVRLTEEAHGLCAEMAHDCNITMKDVASEAVIRMARRKKEDRQYLFKAFALGTISGGTLVFFVGLVIRVVF